MNMHRAKVILKGWGLGSASGERAAIGYHPDGILEGTESQEAGFSGTCETTLTDWIQLVQMGRRDAVVRVRTNDGKEGTLWCQQGDIIDAACDGLAGEDAVYRALSWKGGRVSVDFTVFEHRREIQMATSGLLLGAAYRKDGGVVVRSGTPTVRTQRPGWEKRPTALLFVVAGGLLALVLLFGLVSKMTSSVRSRSTAAVQAPVPVPEFLVIVDVDPAQAAILLDGKVGGLGQLKQVLPRDGRTHEILFSAPGYVSERLLFRDVPPQQRVTLLRSGGSVATVEVSATETQFVRKGARAHGVLARRRVKQSRAISPDIASPTVSEGPREPAPAKAKANANVQIIEERQPRIRIIDEHKPRIEVIQ
jgi:hypothetical protein